MLNSLDPDQAQHLSGLDVLLVLICVQTVCKGYQQTKKVAALTKKQERVKQKIISGNLLRRSI